MTSNILPLTLEMLNPMKALARILPLALSLVLLFSGCSLQVRSPTPGHAPPPAPPPPPAHRVMHEKPAPPPRLATRVRPPQADPSLLLISIDGFRPDYLRRGQTPTLNRLAATGVRARAMQPAFPSKTFPNHYTIVTGLYPDHHGIVANSMVDPRIGRFSLGNRAAVGDGRWWNEAEPIWVTADKHGMRTATMFWPGSEARIHGRRPDYWLPYDGRMTPRQRVRRVLHWLDLPPARRPHFITLYFDRVDHAGHAYGPDSKQVTTVAHRIDAAIGLLVKGLRQRGLYHRMNIIVLSDHGMARSPARNTVYLDRLIDMRDVDAVTLGELASLNPKRGHHREVRKALLRRHRHMRCWDKHHIPARLHYGSNARVPAIICTPQVGWRITTHRWMAHHRPSRGSHGYDNAARSMRALFIAHGPAFRRGVVVPEFPNVDVYPLMMHVLGLPPRPNDGHLRAVRDMLRHARR